MSEHTREPWGVFAQPINGAGDAVLEFVEQVQATAQIASAIYLLSAGGKVPATTGCGPTSKANAARIVSCVNAMAGIPHPAAYVAAFEAMVEAANRLLTDLALGDEEGLFEHAEPVIGMHKALTAARIARGDAA